MDPLIYAFYNNKGGVGKTTLCQNAAAAYAHAHPEVQVLVIDLCPQANISQFFLGGAHKGYQTNQDLQSSNTRKNIVGFMSWLLEGNSNFSSIRRSYKVRVADYNQFIDSNLYLIAGDSFLESLSLALNYAVINPANTNAWKEYMTAVRRLCELEFDNEGYESMTVFIDCNPSFAIYTQMGLVSADYLVVPMMADFSSLEGIKGLLMLLYGEYPTAALKNYAANIITFNKQVTAFGMELPLMYEFAFNSFTANLGVATAYEAVREELIKFTYAQYGSFPGFFAVPNSPPKSEKSWISTFVSDIKDFHTAGKVSASLGIPMYRLPEASSYFMPNGEEVMLPKQNYSKSLEHLEAFVAKLA